MVLSSRTSPQLGVITTTVLRVLSLGTWVVGRYLRSNRMKGIRERGSFYIIISPHSFFNPALFTLICPSGYSFSNFQKPQRLLSITSVQPIQNPERCVHSSCMLVCQVYHSKHQHLGCLDSTLLFLTDLLATHPLARYQQI